MWHKFKDAKPEHGRQIVWREYMFKKECTKPITYFNGSSFDSPLMGEDEWRYAD